MKLLENQHQKMLTVVIPCYNSEHTIEEVVDQTVVEIEKRKMRPQFVLVNDGSADRTFDALRRLAQKYPFVRALDLSKNFGQHNALMAALHHADGDYIMGMDDDLQTHPSQLHVLLDKLEEDYDIVFGKYEQRKNNVFRTVGSWFNTKTAEWLTGRPKGVKTSSYWVAKRFVCTEILSYDAPYPDLQGLFFRVTNRAVSVTIEHFERQHGKSNYNLRRLVKLWLAFTNFSVLPLRAAFLCGIFFAVCGFVGALYVFIRRILHPGIAMGWSSTMVVILFMSGLILLFLGIIGEYLGRLFMTANRTPQFVVREQLNCEKTAEEDQ